MKKFMILISLITTALSVSAQQVPGSWLYVAQEMTIYNYLADNCDNIPDDEKQRMRQIVDDLTQILIKKGFEQEQIDSVYNSSLDKKIREMTLENKAKECNNYGQRLRKGEAFVRKINAQDPTYTN